MSKYLNIPFDVVLGGRVMESGVTLFKFVEEIQQDQSLSSFLSLYVSLLVNTITTDENIDDSFIIGVESDQSVKLNKGESRPIFDQETRQKVLSSLSFVDYVFLINHQLKFVSEAIDDLYGDLYKQLKITHLFTHPQADRSHDAKAKRARELNIEFILQEGDKFLGSSSEIIKKLGL